MAQLVLAIRIIRVQNSGMFKNLLITGLAAIVLPASAAEWMTDLDAAKNKAAAEQKAVLVDFTGSDWCGYCIRLKKNVFDTPAFESYAADKFVLVEVDVPNDQSRVGGPENLARNRALCEKYNIQGFPTIMVMSADGYILGGFVGGQTSLQSTKIPLEAALANADKLKAAQSLQGVERAKALLAIYDSLPAELQESAGFMIEEIAALDPQNETGIQNKMQEQTIMEKTKRAVMACGRDVEKALAIVNETLPQVSGDNKATLMQVKGALLQNKANSMMKTAKTIEDMEAIKAVLLECADCIPEEYRAQYKAMIEKDFADPAALLKKIQAKRK